MESKDGNMGFDLSGVHTEAELEKKILYDLAGARTVTRGFTTPANGSAITQTYLAEAENSYNPPFTGWQAICNNFKTYTENK